MAAAVASGGHRPAERHEVLVRVLAALPADEPVVLFEGHVPAVAPLAFPGAAVGALPVVPLEHLQPEDRIHGL